MPRSLIVRIILFTCLSAFLTWAVPGATRAASPPLIPAPPLDALLARLNHSHPRLLIDAQRFDGLKTRIQAHSPAGLWHARLLMEADRVLHEPPAQYQLRRSEGLLTASRTVLDRVYTLSLVYKTTGNRAYLERLWQELAAAAAFPDWHPGHFLDTAEMTHAFAIAYDWLHQDWSDSQRQVMKTALVNKGLKPGLAAYRGRGKVGWWAGAPGNWNQVCNGGLGLGALSLLKEEPEVAGEVLREALVSLQRGMTAYAPDGGHPEGPMYWGYGTFYTVLFLAALETALGDDLGLSGLEGFAAAGFYPVYLTSVTGRVFNLADASEHLSRTAQMFWLGKRFQQPVFSWYASQTRRPHALDLLWGESPGVSPALAGLPLDRYFRGVEVLTFRSGWDDPQGLFVGFKAGANADPHAHLDLGTFVLDALGHRWALDLGPDNYNLPGYFGKKRHDYYRLRAEGHNTLVINPRPGPDQNPGAVAPIIKFQAHRERPFAVAELSAAYAPAAAKVRRGLALIDRRHLLIQDEIETGHPAEVWWFMHTRAAVSLLEDRKTACLTQGQARMFAHILSPSQATFTVRPARPLPASPHPLTQGDDSDVKKLAIRIKDARNLRLAVVLTPCPPGQLQPHLPDLPLIALDDW